MASEMSAVVFHTPGLIPIESFTTFGVNAKPATNNPIGYFGTGLKYAIAVLCRMGATPTLWIGKDEYTFYVKKTDFRGKAFDMVRMKRKRWSLTKATHHALPFTTELGKTWKPWQAFRELESNTRDEGGRSYLIEDGWRDLGVHHNEPDQTTFIVEHPEFTQAFHDRDDIFLPNGLTQREGGGDRVQVLDKPSKALYFRGLRVAETRKPSLFTYNFVTTVDLTEDRTIKHDFMVRAELARHIVTSTDKKLIEAVLTAPDDKWEHGLEFEYQNEAPSDEFREVIDRRKGGVSRSALRYMGGWTDSASYTKPLGTFELYPRPWLAESTYVTDATGTMVLTNPTDNPQVLVDVVDAVNMADEKEAPPPLPDTTIATVDDTLIPF